MRPASCSGVYLREKHALENLFNMVWFFEQEKIRQPLQFSITPPPPPSNVPEA